MGRGAFRLGLFLNLFIVRPLRGARALFWLKAKAREFEILNFSRSKRHARGENRGGFFFPRRAINNNPNCYKFMCALT